MSQQHAAHLATLASWVGVLTALSGCGSSDASGRASATNQEQPDNSGGHSSVGAGGSTGTSGGSAGTSSPNDAGATSADAGPLATTPGCGLEGAAFCEALDSPSPGGRAGDLDENLWSVARASQKVNSSQGELVSWPSVMLSACGKMTGGVFPDQDVTICQNPVTGRTELTSVFDDATGPVFQSFRALQPFDFAGRVGRISLDIDAKTRTPEGHGWWWEVVIADEPVPVPYQEFVSHALMAHKAVVIEFEGISSFDGTTNELSHVFVEDGYEYSHEFTRDQANFVSFKTKEEVLNHLEIRISQDTLEVYSTDLDDMSTFRKVAHIDGLGLTFTRGYVNLQHSQYNAAKGGLDRFVTYHIGSFGFDGPTLPRPRSYQVPDALVTGRTPDVKNLGYLLNDDTAATAASFTLDKVDLTGAGEARINLNAWYFVAERSIQFRFNGGAWRTFKHPYPESMAQTRAVTMPVDPADLKDGQNTLELRTTGISTQPPMVIANVELEVAPK